MFEFVIWDFDGTLFDTYPVITGVFSHELARLGIDETPERLAGYARISFGRLYEYLAREYGLGSEFFSVCSEKCREAEMKNAYPFVGAFGLCSDIVSSGGQNLLFTHRGETALALLKKAGMLRLFSAYVLATDGCAPKPSPEGVERLAAISGADRKKMIMVGDREIDVLAGKNAGISACLFRSLPFEATCADFVADDFASLRKILI